MDACIWLLESGVSPGDIRWIKPRESWLFNRVFSQGGELVSTLFEGISFQIEAAARAESLDDLFARLRASEQLLRVDEDVTPTMFKAATVSKGEIELLRRIENVVRLGHVQRIERDQIVLDEGTIPTTSGHLHVHCAARGLNPAPAIPIFTAERITPQPVRVGLIPFNSALVGFVEATRQDVAEQNRLCPTNRLPDGSLDWPRGMLIAMKADYLWSKEPDITDWLERARLNPSRGLRERTNEERVMRAFQRYLENVRPGLEKLRQFVAQASA